MFSEIDKIIFPDSCEVIQLTSQHFVYPIMKNGSSSFYTQILSGQRKDWKIIKNSAIATIEDPLMVFIRNPRERFISGVNTFWYLLNRDYPNLDRNTVLWFVDNFLFLNRHYCPQFFWLINLSRFCRPDTILQLEPMSKIDYWANLNDDAGVPRGSLDLYEAIEQFDWKKLELYFYLDRILYDHIGQQFTYNQLLDKIKDSPELYKLVFEKTKTICQHI